ncbi:HK97-gp10 family putative phage morphogenesis protein [Chelativorans sp. AA-79]|uniref:HK97-gp10 family putative phage morphogenesis protein n=1 Tax=Chelativorans sp. AA-79 TaxID=3028735 RepID=UPI0023F664D5|nr:HK97-gp10 family putative phage morphogenesis protein [Chelativorans sp. AA-79]WEX07373.1 HK97 gp10 family phage protein [Chelativorans sp. AA-79]
MVTRVRVEGLRELEQALSELPKATGKNVLRRTLRKAGEPIAEDMRAKAPDDPDTSGEDLRNSIGVGTKLSPNQRSAHRKMFRDDRASVEMFVGAGPVPQAIQQEFGNVNHGPQSFARPAWDAGKDGALETIKTELGNEIGKAAKRLARKAARLAAKG